MAPFRPRRTERRHGRYAAKRASERALALAASTSRSFGGALVTRRSSSCRVTSATASTASSKASWLACDGLVEPLILRTYCSAEAWISSSVAAGSKLWRVLMFRHMPRIIGPDTAGFEKSRPRQCEILRGEWSSSRDRRRRGPRQTLDRPYPPLLGSVRGRARRFDRQRRPADDRGRARLHREQPALGGQCLRPHLRRFPPARRPARRPARPPPRLHVRPRALRDRLAVRRAGEHLGTAGRRPR